MPQLDDCRNPLPDQSVGSARQLHVALAVFQLTKLGGKEHDCIEIARYLRSRGHAVVILTTSVTKRLSAEFHIANIHPSGSSNHRRARAFAKSAVELFKAGGWDILLSFEKTPGADFCYAADCTWRQRTGIKQWTPRNQTYLTLERGVYADGAKTQVFFLNQQLRDEYAEIYKFGEEKGTVLPLIVHHKHIDEEQTPTLDGKDTASNAIRKSLDLPDTATVGITIALNPRMKGVDRALAAISDRDDVHLLVVGSDASWLQRDVRRLRLGSRVKILPYVEDVTPLLRAADFLVHPARLEAAGLVIIESLLAGTPVIVSGICGNASHVEHYGAGISLPEPFSHGALKRAISLMIERLPSFRAAAAAASRGIIQDRGAWLEVIAHHLERAAQDKLTIGQT